MGRWHKLIMIASLMNLLWLACACAISLPPTPESTTAELVLSERTDATTVCPAPLSTSTPTSTPTTTLTPTPMPTSASEPTRTVSQPSPSPKSKPVLPASTSYSAELAVYLTDPANGRSVGEKAAQLNGGEWHNACVYTVSEALRRVGCDIPTKTNYTTDLMGQLKKRGFAVCYDLSQLQPGDICFTTDAGGHTDGDPTHTFVFLSWQAPGVMNVFDNQVYDYDNAYHTRPLALSWFNDDRSRQKEATAFFYRR